MTLNSVIHKFQQVFALTFMPKDTNFGGTGHDSVFHSVVF